MAPPEREPAVEGGAGTADELTRLLQLVGELRQLIPAELDQRLTDSLHELLLALRALIDWLLERQEREHDRPPEVQDIPIL
jgi:hypothetical protein